MAQALGSRKGGSCSLQGCERGHSVHSSDDGRDSKTLPGALAGNF